MATIAIGVIRPCRQLLALNASSLSDIGFDLTAISSLRKLTSPPYRGPLSASQVRRFSTQDALRSRDAGLDPMRKFSYHAAASFSGKTNHFDPATNYFQFNPHNRVQPQTSRPKSKRPASGQDAFFIARVGNTRSLAFGVADGVGGWEESGVDPADFSHGLCDYMALEAYGHDSEGDSAPLTARSLMQKGYDDICSDMSIAAGGSTACIAIASGDGQLEVANLGDSGFMQLRLNAVYDSSEPQIHGFNTPYQLSVTPKSMLARALVFGGAPISDLPKDASVTHHDLKHGDVLVFASDGLWDNLFNQDILRIVSRIMTSTGAWKASDGGIRVANDLTAYTQVEDSAEWRLTLQSAIALEITAETKAASLDQRRDSPFSKEVAKWYPGEHWHGGKYDDICVVVVIVSEDGRAAEIKAKL